MSSKCTYIKDDDLMPSSGKYLEYKDLCEKYITLS
jgi:hypothetical protein